MLQIFFMADAATLLISQNSVGLRNVFQYVVDQCNQISCIACRYQHTLIHRQTKPQWARRPSVCGRMWRTGRLGGTRILYCASQTPLNFRAVWASHLLQSGNNHSIAAGSVAVCGTLSETLHQLLQLISPCWILDVHSRVANSLAFRV